MNQPSSLEVYPPSDRSGLKFVSVVGIGLTTNFQKGYQFRLEARELLVPLSIVTGPSQRDGIAPPVTTAIKRMASLQFGMDLMLAKRVGRRY